MNAMTMPRNQTATSREGLYPAIQRDRRPLSPEAIAAAIAKDRADLARWSASLRLTGRCDAEATLKAELEHTRADFTRIIVERRATGVFDNRDHPWGEFRLPRETIAGAALNALYHASIQARLLREGMGRLRSARRGATNATQSPAYRQAWADRIPTALEDVRQHNRRRQRAWHEFLRLLGEYATASYTTCTDCVAQAWCLKNQQCAQEFEPKGAAR